MSINCEVTLRWDVTSEQRKALGVALWGWCSHAAGGATLYPYLDNQGLADLLAGRMPGAGPTARSAGPPRVLFPVPGDPGRDGPATLASLRRTLPEAGIEGVWVDGGDRAPPQAASGATAAG
jgi:hypothetical protein